ncbi:MAG: transketolase C-terminal domain-containing protein [Candidatus Sungiibacteriota bacterium]
MNRLITLSQALNESFFEEMERNERILILGEDIGSFGGRSKVTKGLLKKFGKERVRDTPLNEELFVSIAIGAAQAGLRPVVEFAHGTLLTLATSDIFRMGIWRWICADRFSLPIVIRVKVGGMAGPELATSLLSVFINLMGITIVAPSTPYQAKGLLKFSLRSNKPIIFLENVWLYPKTGNVPSDDYLYPIGVGEFRKKGKDVSIITYSALNDLAGEVAEELTRERISVEILDLVSLKPLDLEKIIETAQKTKKVIILGDEPTGPGGLFAHIYIHIKERLPDTTIRFFGTKQLPMLYSPWHKYVMPEPEELIRYIKLISRG